MEQLPEPRDRRVVTILAPFYPPAVKSGGPLRSLTALVGAAPTDVQIKVVTRDRDLGGREPMDVPSGSWTRRGGVDVLYSPHRGLDLLRPGWAALKERPAVLYVNSFFDIAFGFLPVLLARLTPGRRTILVAPRGELSPGALAVKAAKKRVFLRLVRALGVYRGVVWHASAELEASEIRRAMGAEAKVIVRENESPLPPAATPPEERPDGTLQAVFLSRIVPKKGLATLLEALQTVSAPVALDVFGPEEDAQYGERCRALAAALPSHLQVRFMGAVLPDEAMKCFAERDVFFFPTHSENFGHVIAEALSMSCPVVLPDTTPWSDRLRGGGGAVVPSLMSSDWASEVDRWAHMSGAERYQARLRAGDSYDRWRRADQGAHIFTQVAVADPGELPRRPF